MAAQQATYLRVAIGYVRLTSIWDVVETSQMRNQRTFADDVLIPGEAAHQNEMMSPAVTE